MIAILLATYNGEKYLDEQLRSISEQTYSDYVVYVHDDGSTDKTVDILFKWKEVFKDKLVIVKGCKTNSAKNNFFYLLSKVEADYYMFSDQDDVWNKDKIEKSIKTIKEYKNLPILVHSDLEVVDEDLNIICDRFSKYQNLNMKDMSLNKLLVHNSITGSTMLFNKELRDLALKDKDVDNIIMHDWWIGLIASQYGKIIYIDEALNKYRQHHTNVYGAISYNSFSFIIRRIKQIKNVKKMFIDTQIQAREFVNCFKISKDSLIYQYAYIGNENKIKRIIFYLKNRMFKKGFWRIIGQIFIG